MQWKCYVRSCYTILLRKYWQEKQSIHVQYRCSHPRPNLYSTHKCNKILYMYIYLTHSWLNSWVQKLDMEGQLISWGTKKAIAKCYCYPSLCYLLMLLDLSHNKCNAFLDPGCKCCIVENSCTWPISGWKQQVGKHKGECICFPTAQMLGLKCAIETTSFAVSKECFLVQ